MQTIREKISELKAEAVARKKQIDGLLESTKEAVDNANKTMESIRKVSDRLKEDLEAANELIRMLSKDYTALKNEINGIKKNKWLRLFGVK